MIDYSKSIEEESLYVVITKTSQIEIIQIYKNCKKD